MSPARRTILVIAVLMLFSAVAAQMATAGTPLDPDEIKAALRTANVEEEGFIEHGVALVEQGRLPRDLFDSTFLWARKKPRHKFQYFKWALTARAADVGIQL
jgi:hypothetical protein